MLFNKNLIWRLVRNRIATKPYLYVPLSRLIKKEGALATNTEVVIEGYPRCGNSFAEAAFRIAQPEAVQIAHHTHAPATVLAGVRRGIPVILVYRNPDDAVVSRKLLQDFIPLKIMYMEYIRFYQAVEPVFHSCILADFNTVTERFGDVIEAMNQKYSTRFINFNQWDTSVIEKALTEVDKLAQHRVGRHTQYSKSRGASYAMKREENKQLLNETINNPQFNQVRTKAHKVYKMCKKNKLILP